MYRLQKFSYVECSSSKSNVESYSQTIILEFFSIDAPIFILFRVLLNIFTPWNPSAFRHASDCACRSTSLWLFPSVDFQWFIL